MTTILVIDTSYLLGLLKVPRFFDEAGSTEVKRRFVEAIQTGCLLFVPIPCIFEVGNHIADVPQGTSRRKLAQRLCDFVKSSVEEHKPWVLIPADVEVLPDLHKLCNVFAGEMAQERVGLTDTCAAQEARRLKTKFSGLDYKVHIWTTDQRLKAQEPDSEENPFVG